MGLGLLDAELLLGPGINEIIAVTKDNAAPIGIIQKPGQMPKMILYKGSKTCENILNYGWVCANFVSDSFLYPYYAFCDCKKSELYTIWSGDKKFQGLKCADAWIGFLTRVLNETGQSYYIELSGVCLGIGKRGVRPVNRGFNAIIEATIHATRYIMNHDEELRRLIEYNIALAKKCGGEREMEGAELIEKVCGL